jgi:AraC-like DNA-binding protein
MLLNLSNSELAYFCLFLVCFTFLIGQVLVKKKQLVHFLFAIFLASLCMMTVQKVSASSLGIYHYLIGFAACATCNVSWLIARALFRKENAVTKRHIAIALFIALLIIANQAWHMINELHSNSLMSTTSMLQIKQGLNEVINLFSSTILLLSFWEAFRNFSSKCKAEKIQRIVFSGAFFTAVFACTFVVKVFVLPQNQADAMPWFILFSTIISIIAIQTVIFLQSRVPVKETSTTVDYEHHGNVQRTQSNISNTDRFISDDDKRAIAEISKLVNEDKIYLQSNLKLLDFAKVVNAPEYRVSRLIKSHFKSPNFNHFINHHRVEHAKKLLRSSDTKGWSILVIGLECGFSSLVSFNRAFKHLSGNKPSHYRAHAPTK